MKHNFKKILCVLLACLMVIPFCTEFAKLPQIWAASSDIVDIPDVNMKAALNSALNVEDSSADITKEQLESLTALKLTDSDDTHITDYTGLEYCVNLNLTDYRFRTYGTAGYYGINKTALSGFK